MTVVRTVLCIAEWLQHPYLYPLDTDGTPPPPLVTAENVFRHRQIVPGASNHSQLGTTALIVSTFDFFSEMFTQDPGYNFCLRQTPAHISFCLITRG